MTVVSQHGSCPSYWYRKCHTIWIGQVWRTIVHSIHFVQSFTLELVEINKRACRSIRVSLLPQGRINVPTLLHSTNADRRDLRSSFVETISSLTRVTVMTDATSRYTLAQYLRWHQHRHRQHWLMTFWCTLSVHEGEQSQPLFVGYGG